MDLVTSREIATECQAAVPRVRHILASRGIEAACRAGPVQLWRPSAIDRVRDELAKQNVTHRAALQPA